MSLFTWGSTSNSALGYVPSYNTHVVDVPKRVSELDSAKLVSAFAGKSFTAVLTEQGHMYRFGNVFGYAPNKATIPPLVSKFSCDYHTGVPCLAIERDTNVVWFVSNGECCRLGDRNGQLIRARDVACVSSALFYIVEYESGSLVEYVANDMLNPRTITSLSPSNRIFCSSSFCAVELEKWREVRLWRVHVNPSQSSVSAKPVVLFNESGAIATSEPDWETHSKMHLRNVSQLSLPNDNTPFGYAIMDNCTGIVVIDLLTGTETSSSHWRAVWLDYERETTFISVSQNRERMLAVDASGRLHSVSHEYSISSVAELVLAQSVFVSASELHTVAIVGLNRLSDIPSRSTLQGICSKTIFENCVSLETVLDVVAALLRRPVVDFPILIDLCLKYMSLNRDLLEYVSKEKYGKVLSEFGFCRKGFERGEILTLPSDFLKCRELNDNDVVPAICRVPCPTERVKLRSVVSAVSTSTTRECISAVASTVETPDITYESPPVIDPGAFPEIAHSVESHISKAELPRSRFLKWKKTGLSDPPVSGGLAPWAVGNSVTTFSQLSKEDINVSGGSKKSSKRAGSSRWYVPGACDAASVASIIALEREENAIAEAVRLVEQFEAAQAEHVRMMSKDIRKRKQFPQVAQRSNAPYRH